MRGYNNYYELQFCTRMCIASCPELFPAFQSLEWIWRQEKLVIILLIVLGARLQSAADNIHLYVCVCLARVEMEDYGQIAYTFKVYHSHFLLLNFHVIKSSRTDPLTMALAMACSNGIELGDLLSTPKVG